MAELTSPMAGKVQEINIKVGQMITEDDELFVIEAMKMENVVYGDTGVVKEIFVKVGDKVIYSKYGGNEVTVDGEEVIILDEDQIYAIHE